MENWHKGIGAHGHVWTRQPCATGLVAWAWDQRRAQVTERQYTWECGDMGNEMNVQRILEPGKTGFG